ncbi:hypothetical protein HGM15179_010254 [Zosterops borbonicus]|uniref:Uncharacterized protein n=1 Tax=Zosterops borbonicus TaxID=364589 RepID=A0A8K1GE97_9PASS|nr:hypothetical protein HGM15179_010254 [Zosterops borbonicus]
MTVNILKVRAQEAWSRLGELLKLKQQVLSSPEVRENQEAERQDGSIFQRYCPPPCLLLSDWSALTGAEAEQSLEIDEITPVTLGCWVGLGLRIIKIGGVGSLDNKDHLSGMRLEHKCDTLNGTGP